MNEPKGETLVVTTLGSIKNQEGEKVGKAAPEQGPRFENQQLIYSDNNYLD